jgi:pyridinium-3,5-biscarboxylic acid mononucleotide synthase
VHPDRLRELLNEVREGRTSVEQAMEGLRELPFRALGFANADTHRHLRTGFPEVILGTGKTVDQIARLLVELAKGGAAVMATRVEAAAAAAVLAAVPGARYHEAARIVSLGGPVSKQGRGTVAVLSAGTADIPIAEEAAVTAELDGNEVVRVFDVGVAGLHRVLAHREAIEAAEVLVVAAGMDGVLPTVVAGLFARPVIALPTSVGYGASFGGIAALLTMLNACATGVAVVNIDNGFGAGRMASLLNRARAR